LARFIALPEQLYENWASRKLSATIESCNNARQVGVHPVGVGNNLREGPRGNQGICHKEALELGSHSGIRP
jgi:hypothetical protein